VLYGTSVNSPPPFRSRTGPDSWVRDSPPTLPPRPGLAPQHLFTFIQCILVLLLCRVSRPDFAGVGHRWVWADHVHFFSAAGGFFFFWLLSQERVIVPCGSLPVRSWQPPPVLGREQPFTPGFYCRLRPTRKHPFYPPVLVRLCIPTASPQPAFLPAPGALLEKRVSVANHRRPPRSCPTGQPEAAVSQRGEIKLCQTSRMRVSTCPYEKGKQMRRQSLCTPSGEFNFRFDQPTVRLFCRSPPRPRAIYFLWLLCPPRVQLSRTTAFGNHHHRLVNRIFSSQFSRPPQPQQFFLTTQD